MLKLKPRRAVAYKCPRHPNQQYTAGHLSPPDCDVCQVIWGVVEKTNLLDIAERKAQQWIQRAAMRKANG